MYVTSIHVHIVRFYVVASPFFSLPLERWASLCCQLAPVAMVSWVHVPWPHCYSHQFIVVTPAWSMVYLGILLTDWVRWQRIHEGPLFWADMNLIHPNTACVYRNPTKMEHNNIWSYSTSKKIGFAQYAQFCALSSWILLNHVAFHRSNKIQATRFN